jgi:hypothetical protein
VIVVAEQRSHPWDKPVFRGVMVESIPEDKFCVFRSKGVDSIAGARGDKVDLIITIPMLEAMFSIEIFAAFRIALSKMMKIVHEHEFNTSASRIQDIC